jgi:Replication-relaxation
MPLRLSIDLQPRDRALLRQLVESRLMTLAHATTLHFEGRKDIAKKRIAKLKAAGLIAERPRRRYEPSILFLTRLAFQTLADRGHLADYPNLGLAALEKRARVSELTVRHELSVMDLKIAFTTGVAKQSTLTLHQFCTWPRLYQFSSSTIAEGFRMRQGIIKPDGYMRLAEETDGASREHIFFIEMDRSTENLASLVARAVAYLDYYRSGGFAVWRGGSRDEYKKYPFRILGVFISEERKKNLAARLLENDPPIRHQWYLATLADAIRDPLGPIWTTPADCEDSADDSPNKRSLLVGT